MRQGRAKTYKKLMELYSRSFAFRQPYQVLVDSSFCTYAVQNKIDIAKQLGVILQGQQKQMITQCSMVELYKLGPSGQATVDVAKTFERRKCNHREAIPNDECIKSVVGETNKHRYIVASQSQPLRAELRSIPFVPLVHINRVVMVLEPASDATLRAKALQETDAQSARAPELAAIAKTQPTPAPSETPRKPKGPKGPNPLSVKKKKPKPGDAAGPSTSQKDGPSKQKQPTQQPRGKPRNEHPPKVGGKRKRVEEDTPAAVAATSSSSAGPQPHTGAAEEEQRSRPVNIVQHEDGAEASDPGRGRKKKRRRKGDGEVGDAGDK